jgi:hypothetical protein
MRAEPLVEVMPKSVYLSSSGGAGAKSVVRLSAKGGSPVTVEKVECEDPAIVARVIPGSDSANVAQVEVSLKPEGVGGDHYSLLRIRTNVPGANQVEIPVQAVGAR